MYFSAPSVSVVRHIGFVSSTRPLIMTESKNSWKKAIGVTNEDSGLAMCPFQLTSFLFTEAFFHIRLWSDKEFGVKFASASSQSTFADFKRDLAIRLSGRSYSPSLSSQRPSCSSSAGSKRGSLSSSDSSKSRSDSSPSGSRT